MTEEIDLSVQLKPLFLSNDLWCPLLGAKRRKDIEHDFSSVRIERMRRAHSNIMTVQIRRLPVCIRDVPD